jgi:hypothetical protein
MYFNFWLMAGFGSDEFLKKIKDKDLCDFIDDIRVMFDKSPMSKHYP